MKPKEIILASTSPRRKEILSMFLDRFTILATQTDETVPDGLSPEQVVLLLAERKARAAAALTTTDSAAVIGADTVVALQGEILGKPADRAQAARMLRKLSGQAHSVYSGVCVLWEGRAYTGFEQTRVFMRSITEQDLAAYIATGDCDDKAGAYAIQGRAGLFIERIEGPYHNVVGLPLYTLGQIFNRLFDGLLS